MEHPWQKLAERVKGAIEDEQRAQARLEAEATARAEAARAARSQLFAELAAFAEAVGHFGVQRRDAGVELTFGETSLTLRAVGDEDGVGVHWAGCAPLQPQLTREGLADRWILGLRSGEDTHWMPLYDAGLSALLHHAFGLPLPAGESPRAVFFTRDSQAQEKIVIIEDEDA